MTSTDVAGRFFAVCSDTWLKVCDLGLNPAVAFLVLGSGAGGDNRTTSWSVNAVEKYTGISRPRAKKAINSLASNGLLKRVKAGTRPQYQILQAEKPSLIWLPNSLITGLSSEVPPVELLRQSKNLDALRLLVCLYRSHSLLEDGGVEWRGPYGIYQSYTREKIGENGEFTVWGFPTWGRIHAYPNAPHVLDHFGKVKPNSHKTKQSSERWNSYWAAISLLESLGLLAFVPHLVDSVDEAGEVIHPLPVEGGEPLEQLVTENAESAAMAMCHPANAENAYWASVPVPKHLSEVNLVGIIRLRYRPMTKLTKAWLKGAEDLQEYAEKYRELAG